MFPPAVETFVGIKSSVTYPGISCSGAGGFERWKWQVEVEEVGQCQKKEDRSKGDETMEMSK